MIKNILENFINKEKSILGKEILSPFVRGDNKIKTKIDEIIYTFKTNPIENEGFGIFKPINHSNVSFIREAYDNEIRDYLDLFPKTTLILIYNIGQWIAYPYNVSAFRNQFGITEDLITVRGVKDVEFLDLIEARFDGSNFWFDSYKFLNGSEFKNDLRNLISAGTYKIPDHLRKGISPEEKIAFNLAAQFHREKNKSNIEKVLEREFKQYEATIDSFVEKNDLVEVRWRDNINSKQYTSILNKNTLSVISAGICLSGHDNKFDLASLITICRDGHSRGQIVHTYSDVLEDY